MPGTPTPRLGLPTINGVSDAVSTYPAVNLSQMDILDNAAIFLSGTAALIPSASSVEPGTWYYATDTGVLSLSNGTAWTTYLAGPGSWAALASLPSHVTAGSPTPQVRVTTGTATVEGRGIIVLDSTGVGTDGTLFTVPSAAEPSANRYGLLANVTNELPYSVTIAPSGAVTVNNPSTSTTSVSLSLDTLRYTL